MVGGTASPSGILVPWGGQQQIPPLPVPLPLPVHADVAGAEPQVPPFSPSLPRTSSPEPWLVPGTSASLQLPRPQSGQALTPQTPLHPPAPAVAGSGGPWATGWAQALPRL